MQCKCSPYYSSSCKDTLVFLLEIYEIFWLGVAIGGGIGVTPLSTTNWYMGFVNNICPECSRGDLDQNIDGDGRWKIEW